MAYGQSHVFRKFLNKTRPRLKFTDSDTYLVFPFDITLGFINNTEAGINDNINIYDFTTFQRVFTGLSNVIAKWQDAYNIYLKNEDDLYLTKEHKVGRVLKGYTNSKSLSTIFVPSVIDDSFTTQMTDETTTIYFDEELAENDLFKLYIIPELNSFKWLYISECVKYYTPDKKHFNTRVVFSSLNNAIASSGRAIEEFVQFGGAGEGYAYPEIFTNDKGKRDVKVNKTREKDIYVQSHQVEISGAAALGSFFCYGRPTIAETRDDGVIVPIFNPRIEAPRRLLIARFETPLPSPINIKPIAETTYFWGTFQPTLWEQYDNWRQQWTNNYNLSDRSQYEGILIAPKFDDIKKSNPLAVDGSHAYILWDQGWQFEVKETFDTSADPMTGETIVLDGNYSIVQVINHMSFVLNVIERVPPSIEQLTSWGFNEITPVLGFLNKFTFGFPLGWRNLAIRVRTPKIPLLIPTTIAKYGNVMRAQQSKDDLFVPLEIFTGSLNTDQVIYSGINSMGTIIKYSLTDRFTKKVNGVDYIFNTRDIGQTHPTTDDDNKPVEGTLPKTLVWDGTCSAVPRKTIGYVIDIVSWKGITKHNYRNTFFTAGNLQTWSGTYKSNALFTGSMADWNNSMKTTDWKPSTEENVKYPDAIVEPNPPTQDKSNVSLFQYLPKTKSYSSNIYGDYKERINKFKYYLNEVAGQICPPFNDCYTKVFNHWVNRGFRFGTYDLTNLGGVNQLQIDYDFIIANFNIARDESATEPAKFSLKIPTNKLVESGIAEYDFRKGNWIYPQEKFTWKPFKIKNCPIVNPMTQNNSRFTQVRKSGGGQNVCDVPVWFTEISKGVFRVIIDGNLLKFGFYEDIEGFIPDMTNKNGILTSEELPSDQVNNGIYMTIIGAFSLANHLGTYDYDYDFGNQDYFSHYVECIDMFIQAKGKE